MEKININRFIDISDIEEIGDQYFDEETGFHYSLIKIKKDKRVYMIHYENNVFIENLKSDLELLKLEREIKRNGRKVRIIKRADKK